MVTCGLATVRAVAVAAGPSPASLTACTRTVTVWPSPRPVSLTWVPSVTSTLRPFASTTYRVIGRPLSTAAAHVTRIAPGSAATVLAESCRGAPGTVNGTTVLLSGDDFEPAPLSVMDTTVKAYWVPYSNKTGAITSSVLVVSPIGVVSPAETAVPAYLTIWLPWPLAAGHVTCTEPSGRSFAVTLSGGSGTSAVGTTGLLVRAGPAPLAFTACTEKR